MNKFESIIYLLMLVIFLNSITSIAPAPTQNTITYCHFEDVSYDLPRESCFNMKIVSKDNITMQSLDYLNFSYYACSPDYYSLPSCSGENMYFTYYSIESVTNRSIDGMLAFEYYIDYLINDTIIIYQFEDAFMREKYNSSYELSKRFMEFDGW